MVGQEKVRRKSRRAGEREREEEKKANHNQ